MIFNLFGQSVLIKMARHFHLMPKGDWCSGFVLLNWLGLVVFVSSAAGLAAKPLGDQK